MHPVPSATHLVLTSQCGRLTKFVRARGAYDLFETISCLLDLILIHVGGMYYSPNKVWLPLISDVIGHFVGAIIAKCVIRYLNLSIFLGTR